MKKWKSKFGFHATYGTLLKACLRKESLNCAEKIVILLGAAGGNVIIYFCACVDLLHAGGPTRFPSSLGSKHLGELDYYLDMRNFPVCCAAMLCCGSLRSLDWNGGMEWWNRIVECVLWGERSLLIQ